MYARTLFLAAAIVAAALSSGCSGPQIVVLSQAYVGLPPAVQGKIAVLPVDFHEVDGPENMEYKQIIQHAFEEPLRKQLGLGVASQGAPLQGLYVVRPRVTAIDTGSLREMLHMRVEIFRPDGALFDSIALRDIPYRCFVCPGPGDANGPTPQERARAEGAGLGEALADYLDRRMRGWSARSGG